MSKYNQIFFILWGFVNTLFILKYAPVPTVVGVGGGFILSALLALIYEKGKTLSRFEKPARIFWYLSIIGTLILQVVLLLKIDRYDIDLDRWSAIQYFWDSAFRGEFPYAVKTHLQIHNTPSPLPVWMVFMLPFYFLGDVGILQPVVFLGIVFVITKRFTNYVERFVVLLLIVVSPAFWYESLTRSDLVSCLTVSLAVLWLIHRLGGESGWKRSLLIATVLGGVMSTRAVLSIPAALIIASISKRKPLRFLGISTASIPVFLLTLLPFYLWDSVLFMENNPLTLHSNKSIPGLAQVTLIIALVVGFKTNSFKKMMFTAGVLIFLVTAVSFAALFDEGSILHLLNSNSFDITYFTMAFPFLFVGMVSQDSEVELSS